MIWPTKKLGECLVQFDRGISWSRKDEGGTVAVLRIPNIREGQIILDDLKYIDTENENSKLEKDDIVMVASNGNPDLVGRSALVTKKEVEMRFASFLVRLRFDSTKLLPQYAHLFLLTPVFKRELRGKITTTSGIYNLRKNHIEKIDFPLPPLKIQKQIVERMDKIAEAQKLNDKQIELTEELFQSLLHRELDPKGKNWEVKKLGEVCVFYNGQAHEKYINENGNYVVINSKFIASNGMEYKKTNNALFLLLRGDITMVMSDVPKGQALAKCFFVDKNDTYTLNQRICTIRSKNFENKFLYYQLNRNKYFLRFDNGQSQTNLRKNDILDCPLLIPPLETQKQIVEKLSAAQEYKKQLLDQKMKLKELFNSVLHKSMNSQRTPK